MTPSNSAETNVKKFEEMCGQIKPATKGQFTKQEWVDFNNKQFPEAATEDMLNSVRTSTASVPAHSRVSLSGERPTCGC